MSNELERLQAELAEAREVQTAMADVMTIFANTCDDLGGVLQQLAAIATRLCLANSVVVGHFMGDVHNFWSQRRGHISLPASSTA